MALYCTAIWGKLMIDLMFFICGILLVGSYLFRDLLILRLITMVAMVFNTAGGILMGIHAPGMKSLIFFSAIIFFVNAYRSTKIILGRMPVFLPDEIKDVYMKNFNMMTTNEFLRIYKFALIKKFKKGEQLTTEDQPVKSLMLIKNGRVNIIKNGQSIERVDSHFFIGEMSFLSGELATATVEVESDEIEMIEWDKAKLNQLKKDDYSLYDKLEAALAINLIKKINRNL